jgi:hypothetical protein
MKAKLLFILSLGLSLCCHSQTVLFSELFDDADVESRNWYDNTTPVISTSEHIPGSTGSAEYHWLAQESAPTSGGAMRKLFTPSDSVYVDFWVKYSSNYTGSNQSYHPHEFLILTTEDDVWIGPAYTHLTAYIEQNEGIPLLALQDGLNIDLASLNTDLTDITENRSVCGCNGIRNDEIASYVDCYQVADDMYWNGKAWKAGQVYFQDTPGAYYKSDWHHITAFFKLNTVSDMKGNPDGVIRYWYDDELLIQRTNIIMRTASHESMQFNQFMIAPWIGDGSPVDQTFWVDNLTLSTGSVTTRVPDHRDNNASVFVQPNPSTGSAVVDFRNLSHTPADNLSFSIYNSVGNKVNEFVHIPGDRLILEKLQLPSGIYIYHVRLNDEFITAGKMVIQ